MAQLYGLVGQLHVRVTHGASFPSASAVTSTHTRASFSLSGSSVMLGNFDAERLTRAACGEHTGGYPPRDRLDQFALGRGTVGTRVVLRTEITHRPLLRQLLDKAACSGRALAHVLRTYSVEAGTLLHSPLRLESDLGRRVLRAFACLRYYTR